MEIVCYSGFYRDVKNHGLEYAAKHARALGFDAVEFLEFAPQYKAVDCLAQTASEAKRILDAYGLRVSCFSVCVDLLYGANIERTMERMRQLIDFAAAIGSPKLHHTLIPTLNFQACTLPYADALQAVLPHAKEIANRCAAHGMLCLYEPQGAYFNGVEGLNGFYERIKRECPNVGICADLGNGVFADTSACDICDAFIGEIRHVHAKDYRVTDHPEADKACTRSRDGRYVCDCAMGEGVTDFVGCFAKLKQAGYRGDVALEIEGDDETVQNSIAFLKTVMKEG